MSGQRLVLIDLDNTLIDKDYELSGPEAGTALQRTLRACRRAGIIVGLASDTPTGSLQIYADRFGMMGHPLVAEYGACVVLPDGTKIQTKGNLQPMFAALKRSLIRHVSEERPGTSLFVGNCVELIRRYCQSEVPEPLVDGPMVLINGLREYSLGFWAYSSPAGNPDILAIDTGLLNQLVTRVRLLIEAFEMLGERFRFDVNLECGLCIVHEAYTEKRNALPILREHFEIPPERRILMIGDSMGDYLNDPGVVQCGVGNSKPEYREKCQHTANEPITDGVIEILERVLEDPEPFFC